MAKKQFRPSANNVINFSDTLSETLSNRVDTDESVLNLTHEAVVQHKIRTTSSDLILNQSAFAQSIINETASNVIILTSTNIKSALPILVSAESTIPLLQTTKKNLHAGTFESNLVLTQTVVSAIPRFASTDSNITYPKDELIDVLPGESIEGYGLKQEVSVNLVLNIPLAQRVYPQQKSGPTKVGSANSHIQLSQFTRTVLYEKVLQTLNLSQTVTYDVALPVSNTLELVHSVTVLGILVRATTSQLNCESMVTFHRVQFCDYDIGVGAGDCGFPVPTMVEPILVRRATTILTYPYITPTETLELRNPDFDNSLQLEFRRINRRSRGGTLQIYRDEAWPKSERLIFSVSALKEQTSRDLLFFLNMSVGKEIGLLDFESRQWRGIILTPSTQIKEDSKVGFSASLEFEGVKV